MKCHCGSRLLRTQYEYNHTLKVSYRCNKSNYLFSNKKKCKKPLLYEFTLSGHHTYSDHYTLIGAGFHLKDGFKNYDRIQIACIGIVHKLIFNENLSTDLIKMVEMGHLLS